MSATNRIFVSFAIEDSKYRDLLVGQARNEQSPFVFTDMSVKQPWDSKWKTHCRSRIKGCDGVVGIITGSSINADGQIWELECAYSEKIPVFLMYPTSDRPSRLPSLVSQKRINVWSWPNIDKFLERL